MDWLARALDRAARERHEIRRRGDPYLTRWVLCGSRFGHAGWDRAVFVHRFHSSDPQHLHDHPWPFTSLILAGGYWEDTPAGTRWYGPGRLLRRPAAWRHRVRLAKTPGGHDREAWTVIWRGRKEKSWGFFCPGKYLPWREYLANQEAGAPVCGPDEPPIPRTGVPRS